MPLRILFAVAVAVGLSRCASQDSMAPPQGVLHDACGPLVLSPPEGATDAQRDAIAEAARSWNQLGFTRLATSGEGEPIALRFQKAAGMFHGLYDTNTGEVVLNTDLTDVHELSVVVAHEVGHAMGLPHVALTDRLSVMNPGNTALAPTAEDSARVQALCSPP